jgi:hypothetical protein
MDSEELVTVNINLGAQVVMILTLLHSPAFSFAEFSRYHPDLSHLMGKLYAKECRYINGHLRAQMIARVRARSRQRANAAAVAAAASGSAGSSSSDGAMGSSDSASPPPAPGEVRSSSEQHRVHDGKNAKHVSARKKARAQQLATIAALGRVSQWWWGWKRTKGGTKGGTKGAEGGRGRERGQNRDGQTVSDGQQGGGQSGSGHRGQRGQSRQRRRNGEAVDEHSVYLDIGYSTVEEVPVVPLQCSMSVS